MSEMLLAVLHQIVRRSYLRTQNVDSAPCTTKVEFAIDGYRSVVWHDCHVERVANGPPRINGPHI